MNEAELDSLLLHCARRLRAVSALRWALLVLGFAAVAVAVAVFLWRMAYTVPAAEMQRIQASQAQWSVLPFVLAGSAFIAAFFLARPQPSRVAAELDSRARLQDHLLTWLQLRAQTMSGQQQEFREAQSRSTLQLAKGLSVKTMIPIQFPEWAPALWMALIGLCCALLVPPQIEVESAAAARDREQGRRKSAPAVVVEGAAENTTPATPRVQPLSPTELLKLQLRATDPNLANEQRKQILAEVQQKIGGVPENELTDDVRELLRELRGNSEIARVPNTDLASGSAQQAAKAAGEVASNGLSEAANAVSFRERGLAFAQREFFDVKDELNRYYSGGNEK